MYITNQTYNKINDFLALTFQMNSFSDNIAYNLGYNKMIHCEPIFHEKFAHVFPKLADIISELMLKLEARPIRKELSEDSKEYSDNIEMFKDLKEKTDFYREEIIKLIEIAEINDDFEVTIAMEDFLTNFTIYLNQINIWLKKAIEYGEKVQNFDHDFESFTIL